MSDSINLYAPPKARVEDVAQVDGEAAQIRTEHIKREASIRAVGMLNYMGGVVMCLGAVAFLLAGLVYRAPDRPGWLFPIIGLFFAALGVLSIFVGRGLRQFRQWARITTIVLSSISVLSSWRNPLGGVISVYIIYLLLSAKGRRIFQDDYPDIVAATPDFKYKTSIVLWLVLGLLFLVLVAAGVAMALRR
jgi:hypothetical protein